jgi:hypothetical protein
MLLTKEVEVKYVEAELNSNTIKYYKNLGYDIPKLLNKQNKLTTPKGTKIAVKENDLFTKKLVGNKYGMLTVVDYDYKRSNESYAKNEYFKFWLCKCDCGNENLTSVNQMSLLSGKSTSCGCMFKKNRYDLVGNIYGRLIVVQLDEERTTKSITYWLCKCNCGNENLISIESDSLKRRDTQSCGCLWKESISGENSHYWQGGITELYQHLRNKIEPWTVDTFIKYNRKCLITNKTAEVIHHLINFSDIVKESLKELDLPIYKNVSDYSEQEINNIDKLVLYKHYLYNCGIPLRKDIHNVFHTTYGYKNNSIEQFIEFVDKIYKKEIEIPYWTDDKNETWKKLIDDKITEINNINKV